MSRDIIMSVKARHIRNMRAGLKRLELRKTRPGQETPLQMTEKALDTIGLARMTNRDQLIDELAAMDSERERLLEVDP